MTRRKTATRTASAAPRPALLCAALCAVLLWTGSSAQAQEMAVRLGSSLQISGAELEVTADQLEVDQATGTTTFTGNVLAVQGDLRLTAGDLRLDYGPGAAEGSQRITRLVAGSGVTVVTPDEAVEARTAVYALDLGTLEMSGDVLLVQGTNLLSGERFTVDLNTGAGRMSGRVRTVIRLD